jgi:hypothetical protein
MLTAALAQPKRRTVICVAGRQRHRSRARQSRPAARRPVPRSSRLPHPRPARLAAGEKPCAGRCPRLGRRGSRRGSAGRGHVRSRRSRTQPKPPEACP